LLEERLQRDGLSYLLRRVETADAFRAAPALEAEPDLVFAEVQLQAFSARAALEILREQGCPTPLIVVAGDPDDTTLASLVRAGAARAGELAE
jgi:DNA-binding NarL/FixJ family response regulator